jgi:molybdopterin-dependent oxidoreductase alpha subunit
VGIATKLSLEHMGLVKTARAFLAVNQKEGFDCPGCAWPDPQHRSPFEFCENGAKAVADEATKHRVTPTFFARHSLSELSSQSDYWLNRQGRITHPMIRLENSEHYEPISWDNAFARIGRELGALSSPDEAIFYTSGRTSNEAAFLYQLFVRKFGTNNLPDCSNMCHESSGTGLGQVIGIGKGTVTLEDFSRAQLIYVIGQNPGTNHPRMLSALREAKHNGARVISVNPLREVALERFKHPQKLSGILGSGTPITDLFLQVQINGDVALLVGIMKAMLEEEDRRPGEVFDHEFIQTHTHDYDAFVENLRAFTWDELLVQSGVTREQVQQAADLTMSSERIIVCWAMGLTQHKNGVANIQSCVNLLLLRGAIGKPGAGVCPVRGHSNVQGDRTMGIWEKPSDALLDKLASRFSFEPPRHHGYDTVHAIKAMHEKKAHVFFAMGGNFLSATPDTEYTARALQNCRLTVQVSTKLNRSHLVTGTTALILPCLGRTEQDLQHGEAQFVSVENSMGIVHRSRGKLAPASQHLLSEPRIVARLASATLPEDDFDWNSAADNYDRIREHIGHVIPGFERYNERVRQRDGFVLPNAVRDNREFRTHNGKANFTTHPLPKHELLPGQFMMMTLRSHDQYNTTIYGNDDRYRGLYGTRRVVLLHAKDIQEENLVVGQLVDLVSHFRGEKRRGNAFIVVPYDVPRKSAVTYFPEANVLVPVDSFADKSHTPTSKSVIITLEAHIPTEPKVSS